MRQTLIAARIIVLHSPSGAGKTSLLEARNGLRQALVDRQFMVHRSARVGLPPPPGAAVNRYVYSVIRGLTGDAGLSAAGGDLEAFLTDLRGEGPRRRDTASVPFVTAYVIEYALSVDNLFVFLIIFSAFKVDKRAQHRLLYWVIIGAFLLRGLLIGLGTTLVSKFEWVLYIFGVFLLYTAWKLLFAKEADGEVDPEPNPLLKWGRRALPVSTQDHGLAFFVREGGKAMVTPLFLVLLVVETTDVLFALDSIPAVLAISQDPFLVFSSNACAILGLRDDEPGHFCFRQANTVGGK